MWTEHSPEPSVVQVFTPPTRAAEPEVTEKVTRTPEAGAEPVPSFLVTVAVMVCASPILLYAVAGEIERVPSTTESGSQAAVDPL